MYSISKFVRRLTRKPRFEYLQIWMLDLSKPTPRTPLRIDFELEELPPDAKKVRQLLSHIPPEHTYDIEERIDRKHFGLAGKADGTIVYIVWVGDREIYSYLLDRSYALSEEEVYAYGAYTLPKYRNLGIHKAAAAKKTPILYSRGYRRQYAFIEHDNLAARRMPEQLGFRKIGITGFAELFGIRFYFHFDQGSFVNVKRRHYLKKT
jgi:GNAT superfamily N-acetyltransferase